MRGAAEVRSWMPPEEDSGSDLTIVKGRSSMQEEARPLARDLPKPEAEPPSEVRPAVLSRAGRSGAQARLVETLDEADGPVEMPRAEIERIEEDFRTEFSLALIRLKGKRDEGIAALEKMVARPGPFAVEHKFMFTDCGLALRKRNFYALANQYHERARKLSPDDEHVLFNQARVMYESGRIDKARACLQLALDMVPAFGAAKDFLAFIDGPNKR
jgi:tetratricopeptide (TPR) repeat protein